MRENSDAAAASTVWPTGSKLTAFAISGGIAGFAGGFLGGLYVTVLFAFFAVETSVQILAISVIGGVGSVAGPVLGSLWGHRNACVLARLGNCPSSHHQPRHPHFVDVRARRFRSTLVRSPRLVLRVVRLAAANSGGTHPPTP